MKLKYYIRTLGIGIFVTALLMGFATIPKTRDDVSPDGSSEVLSNQVLSEVASTTEESKETKENTEEVNENQDEPEVVTNKESENPPERESKPQKTEENTAGESIESEETDQEETPPEAAESFAELEIQRGDSSDKVSRRLQELGLIEDAKIFDRYLCDNGYDKRISVGSYRIPTNSSEEEIALIISGKKK